MVQAAWGDQGCGDMGIGCPGLLEPRDAGTWGQDTQVVRYPDRYEEQDTWDSEHKVVRRQRLLVPGMEDT